MSTRERIKAGAARVGFGMLRAGVDAAHGGLRREPPAGPRWRRVLNDVRERVKAENLPFLAAGLAYYGILAIAPGLIAVVSIYGLVGDPSGVAEIVANVEDAVPAEVAAFLEGQLTSIVETSSSSLGISFAISVIGALWAASNGTKALIRGVNLAYGLDETRPFVKLRLLSLGITIALLAFVAVLLTLVVAGHRILGGSSWFNGLAEYGRWPVVLAVTVALLAGFYRVAPPQRRPEWRVASAGAVFAGATWLVASFGLSIYVSRFGSFNETYGTLGAVVVVLLWLFVSAFIVLLGAVVDRSISEVA